MTDISIKVFEFCGRIYYWMTEDFGRGKRVWWQSKARVFWVGCAVLFLSFSPHLHWKSCHIAIGYSTQYNIGVKTSCRWRTDISIICFCYQTLKKVLLENIWLYSWCRMQTKTVRESKLCDLTFFSKTLSIDLN